MNTVARFSNRVENYIKYRPGYPPEVLNLFKNEIGLREDSVIADVGSGPGTSAQIFLKNGNTVYGVEPNDGMRAAAEKILEEFPNFKSTSGTAENTGLPDDSIDFVIAAQAFHWFDPEKSHQEFERILKGSGYIVLIWNERLIDTTPFLREYEQFLLRYANDYALVRHENVNQEALNAFFGMPFLHASFENEQIFDFDGLKGRMLSSSYMPDEANERFDDMVGELRTLFAKHAEHDKIRISYDTNVYWSTI
jgi:SAM-dependent methyltransferase